MQGIQFDYFWGGESEQFTFYRIPKLLFTAEYFKGISCEAKVLYGLMLDRMGLSYKNNWFDADGRVYIVFTLEDVMELLNCGRQKSVKILAELDSEKGIGLIERRRLGLGKPNVIFLKNFMRQTSHMSNPEFVQTYEEHSLRSMNSELQEVPKSNFKKYENQTSGSMKIKLQEVPESNFKKYENQTSGSMKIELQEVPESNFKKYENQTSGSMKTELQEVPESNFKKYENQTSGSMKIELQEVSKSYSNNTDINDTDCNDTIPSYLSVYEREGKKDPMDMMSTYRRIVRENISYDSLVKDGVFEIRELDELVELMVEVFLLPDEFPIRVSGAEKTAAVVKNRFMKISMMHIVYVLNCLKNTTTKIGNIKAYMLTTLYNSTLTMEHYYQAQVGYDLQNVDIV